MTIKFKDPISAQACLIVSPFCVFHLLCVVRCIVLFELTCATPKCFFISAPSVLLSPPPPRVRRLPPSHRKCTDVSSMVVKSKHRSTTVKNDFDNLRIEMNTSTRKIRKRRRNIGWTRLLLGWSMEKRRMGVRLRHDGDRWEAGARMGVACIYKPIDVQLPCGFRKPVQAFGRYTHTYHTSKRYTLFSPVGPRSNVSGHQHADADAEVWLYYAIHMLHLLQDGGDGDPRLENLDAERQGLQRKQRMRMRD